MRQKIAATGVDIDEAGRRIWAALPPPEGVSVISFGEHPTPERGFGGDQVRMLQERRSREGGKVDSHLKCNS
jgi:hypothetical protein